MHAILQDLKQPEYVHVLINHLPLAGLLAAWLSLVAALIMRNRVAVYIGMTLVGLFALSAWPVVVYGEKGYDRVYSMVDDDGDAYLKYHKELAQRLVWTYYVVAGVAGLGLAAAWKRPRTLWATALVTVVLALGSLAAGGVIAYYGGQVRHPEFQNGSPPKASILTLNQLPAQLCSHTSILLRAHHEKVIS